MPELPEVEVVCQGLNQILKDEPKIIGFSSSGKKLRFPLPRRLKQKIAKQKIHRVERRAKYLLWILDDCILVSHLGMTGSWRIFEGESKKHDHLFIELDNGKTLVYHDPRRFGFLDLTELHAWGEHKFFKDLGPEPFDNESFSADSLFKKSRKKSTSIKAFIMDQKVVVGVGNIYACEALYLAGVKPQKACGRVTKKQYEKLVAAIQKVLSQAIQAGGSTISDFRQAGGSSGYFQHQFQVYGKAGQPCPACGEALMVKKIVGRSTFWCKKCQS